MFSPDAYLHAQTSTTDEISGVVYDPTGAAIPNAKVVLSDLDTRNATTRITDERGIYRFPLVKPGNYSLSASAPGFGVSANV